MATIFEKIARGEAPCHKVWEDDKHLAFLDIAPLVAGHTLVIPKQAYSYVFDMPPAEYAALWSASYLVAAKLKRALGVQRVCIHVEGFEIQHVHVHLLPSNNAVLSAPSLDRHSRGDFPSLAAKIAKA